MGRAIRHSVVALGSVVALSACWGKRSDDTGSTTAGRSEELETLVAERVIPIRFVHIRPAPDGAFNMGATKDQHSAVVHRLNEVFRSAGIQFVIRSIESRSMPILWTNQKREDPALPCSTRACSGTNPCPTGQTCSPGGQCFLGAFPQPPCFWNGGPGGTEKAYTWTQVVTDFQGIPWLTNNGAPLSAASPPYTAFSQSNPADWTGAVMNQFAPKDEVVFWVLGDDGSPIHPLVGVGAFADGPESSRLTMGRGTFGFDLSTNQASTYLAHEFGHHFGLPHSDGTSYRDPATGAPAPMYNFWDLVFCPGTNSSPHVFPQNASQAASCSTLVTIDRGSTGAGVNWPNCTLAADGKHTCKVSVNPPLNGTCIPAIITGRCEVWTNDDAPLKNRWLAKSDSPSDVAVPYGSNIMTYYQLPSSAPNRMSASQAAFVRKQLRYQQASIDSRWSGARVGRADLGSAPQRPSVQKLDYDGDGKRDFAFWQPPLTASGTGKFVVLLSKKGFSTTSGDYLNISVGKVGVHPAPADFTGDGRTDVGFIETDNTTGALTWKWCPTYSGDAVTGTVGTRPQDTVCPGLIPNETFGWEGMTPLVGTDFDANAATGEVATYDPVTGSWAWKYIGGATVTRTPACVNWGGTSGCVSRNVVPLPGLYDNDSKTDLAVYDPVNARFVYTLSPSNWTTVQTTQFATTFIPNHAGTTSQDRAGAVVVPDMLNALVSGSTKVARRSFALFDPDTGAWAVQWDPAGASAVATCTAGVAGDVPIGGLGTLLTASPTMKRSDLSVFRSRSETTGPSLLRTQSDPTWCGSNTSVDLGVVPQRRPVFSVWDIDGDSLMDVVELRRDEGAIKVWTSASGFVSSVTYPLPQSVVTASAEFL